MTRVCRRSNPRVAGWQSGHKRAAKRYKERFGKEALWGFEHLRVHDLKHTFGRKLRAARVPFETRQLLLGHKNGSIRRITALGKLGGIDRGGEADRRIALDTGTHNVAGAERDGRREAKCYGKSIAAKTFNLNSA